MSRIDSALNPNLAPVGALRSVERPLSQREELQRGKALCAANPTSSAPSCSGNHFVGMFFDGAGNNGETSRRRAAREAYEQTSKGETEMSRIHHLWTACRVLGVACGLTILTLLMGCEEEKIPVSVTGYNHMSDESIMGFSVNGAGGANAPPGGGGGNNCCIAIPKHWRPGMKAHVSWAYGHGAEGTRPPPPPQEATVDIPEYTPENLGDVQVHFYPNHRIKVVVSRYSLGHPLYPLAKEDWAPWTIDENVVRNLRELAEEQRRK